MNITNILSMFSGAVLKKKKCGLQWAVGLIIPDWHNSLPCIPCQQRQPLYL